MQIFNGKLALFIWKTGRDIEFIDPNAHKKELEAKGELTALSKASQYDNLSLLYRDPGITGRPSYDEERLSDPERGYHKSVFKYATDPKTKEFRIPIWDKKNAMIAFNLSKKMDQTLELDTVNGCSFEEVPDDMKPPTENKVEAKVAKNGG